jgi:hypothetical protein
MNPAQLAEVRALAPVLLLCPAMGAGHGRAPEPPDALPTEHCAACHGADSALGGWARRCCPRAWSACASRAAAWSSPGPPATQMPGFATSSSAERDRRAGAVDLHAGGAAPQWGEATSAPRASTAGAGACPQAAFWRADPMNLFVVVEGGDHHVSLLDGDRFEPSTASLALRAARRAEVHARRALRLLRLARRLDHQVRPVEPDRGGRGARRPQHAQRGVSAATAAG